MELEKQVCSFELARKLKELGIKQKSLFWWRFFPNYMPKDGLLYVNPSEVVYSPNNHQILMMGNEVEWFSAFTIAELGEMLPWDVKGKCFKMFKSPKFFNIGYDDCFHSISDEKEADARAKMLIYILENGLVKNENLPKDQVI